MSEESKPPAKQPVDLRSILHFGGKDSRRGVLDALISSDENNPTKSRIPSPAGMAVYQLLGLWGSTKKEITLKTGGKEQKFARNVEGLHAAFKALYDENAISLWPGESRREYVTSSLGYFLQDIEDIDRMKQERAAEGQKK